MLFAELRVSMDVLVAALLRHTSSRPPWLVDAIAGRPAGDADVALAFGGAPYAVGRDVVALGEGEAAAARACGASWLSRGPTADLVARVVLVRAIAAAAGDPLAALRRLFVTGDNYERAAVLRALPLLDEPARFVPLAAEGCRTNVKPVFEAIACENAFPSRHLPDAAFFQMVLKAVFIETPLARIEGLAARTNDELRRMARDYASERRAAGRAVPDDIHVLLADKEGSLP